MLLNQAIAASLVESNKEDEERIVRTLQEEEDRKLAESMQEMGTIRPDSDTAYAKEKERIRR
jgi:hypothetical protein